MVPFDVKINGKKVGISWESLFWFFVVTAGATIVGEAIYDQWVGPYITNLRAAQTPAVALQPPIEAPPTS